MNTRMSIQRGGERNWENAHKNKNIIGIKQPIFGYSDNNKKFCGWNVIDEAAENKMNAGYSKKKNPVCSKCFTTKSVSGKCNCE